MMERGLATVLAWGVVTILAVIAYFVIHRHRHVTWGTLAAFVVGTEMLALAAAITASNALLGHGSLSGGALWLVIMLRAAAATLFLGVTMALTRRPRWVGRIMERLIGGLL